MKTKKFLFSLLVSFSLGAFAQETTLSGNQTVGYKTPFVRNGACDNWFVGIGVGAQTVYGDDDSDATFLDRITVAPTLTVGKWFGPYWGFRVKGQGGSLHGYEQEGMAISPPYHKGLYMQHINYYNVHVDALWNVSNYWGVYSPTKFFNLTPYIGLGFAHRFQLDETITPPIALDYSIDKQYHRYANVISINTGVQFGLRLSEHVNLDFDLGTAVVPDYFDRYVYRAQNELILAATGGLTYKLGKTTFEVAEPTDYDLINSLNGKINDIRAENTQLSKRPASCPECPQVAPIIKSEVNYVPNVVFFRLNSSKIDENQQISVYNTAEFIKKNDEKIKVIGYADKKTGSGAGNLKLSEKRARAVAKELTAKYNIPSEKIIIEWKGSDEQPYQQNTWNRVVIMSAQ